MLRFTRNARIALLATLAALGMLGGTATAEGGAYRVIHNFKGNPNDGWGPMGVPVVAMDGDLYGVTVGGGTNDLGTVFRLTAPQSHGGTWKETVLYNFTSGGDGQTLTSLARGEDGTLYGAGYNDVSGLSLIFRLRPPGNGDAWQYDVLYTFNNDSDGINPQGIALDTQGNIYGATGAGGDLSCPAGYGLGCGLVFELKRPTKKGGKWAFSVLYAFTGPPDGVGPAAGVTLDQEGNVYGTSAGGVYGYGAVYRVSPPAK